MYFVERSSCGTPDDVDEVDDVGIHVGIGTISDCHISYCINKNTILLCDLIPLLDGTMQIHNGVLYDFLSREL